MSLPNPSELRIAASIFSGLRKYSITSTQNKILTALENEEISISDAKKQSPSYLACIIRTVDAIERASAAEKINTLKNLFIICEASNLIEENPDLYQEMLSIFSELSYREILILYYLSKGGLPYTDDLHVKSPESATNNDALPNPQVQYEEAVAYTAKKLKISTDVLNALMGRLARSGLIGSAEEWQSLVYFFTPLYRELQQFFSYSFYETDQTS